MKQDATPMSNGARTMTAITVILALFASCILPVAVQAQAPDPYEPDDPGTGGPPWIANDELHERSFYPEGDVDYARFRVKAGHWYDVHTRDLAPLVDTVLTVELGGLVYQDDDGGPEPLASRVTFQATETTDAIITVANDQEVYSTTQTYKLYAGEIPAPTPTPTNTLTPTPTPTAIPPIPGVSTCLTPTGDQPQAIRALVEGVERGVELGVNECEWAWGCVFWDPDGDGDRDLFVTNGFASHHDRAAPAPSASSVRMLMVRSATPKMAMARKIESGMLTAATSVVRALRRKV